MQIIAAAARGPGTGLQMRSLAGSASGESKMFGGGNQQRVSAHTPAYYHFFHGVLRPIQ